MKYDNDIVESIVRERTNERIKLDAAVQAKRLEVYEKLPRVREIDSELASTAFDIIRASFGKKESAADVLALRREKNEKLIAERKTLLTEAGFSPDVTEAKYICDVCNDTGYDGGVLCRCMHGRYEKAVAEKINSNLRIPNISFSDFKLNVYPENGTGTLSPRSQMKEVLSFCRNFAENFSDGAMSLFINGSSGLGKTFLAQAIARTVAERGFSVIYDTAFSLLGALEDIKFGRREDDLDAIYTCSLLIIDDVGCEMATPFTTSALYNIINSRLLSGKSTVVISPLKREELSVRYGAHTLSRLEGDFVKLEFLGSDIRLMR